MTLFSSIRRSKMVGILLFAIVENAMPISEFEADVEKLFTVVSEMTFVLGAQRPATQTVSRKFFPET